MEVKPPDAFEQYMFHIERSLDLIEAVHDALHRTINVLAAALADEEGEPPPKSPTLDQSRAILNDQLKDISQLLHWMHEEHIRQEAAIRDAQGLMKIIASIRRGEMQP